MTQISIKWTINFMFMVIKLSYMSRIGFVRKTFRSALNSLYEFIVEEFR